MRHPALIALVAVAVIDLAGRVASAGPDASHKAAPDKFTKAASEAFAAASAADAKGDLATALGLYQKAYEISPHSSTAYNIGDVQRRLGKLTAAIKAFETYLALSPNAADRRDVEAQIDKLSRVPGTMLVFTGLASDPNAVDFKNAYILVDGEIKIRPGAAKPKAIKELGGQLAIAIEATGKSRHTVDVVTSITYGTQACIAAPGERQPCFVRAKPRIDGRVVLGTNIFPLDVRTANPPDRRGKSVVNQRFELAPGHYKLAAREHGYECTPIVFDVATGSDIAYVFVSSPESDGFERCRTLDIKQQKLHFE